MVLFTSIKIEKKFLKNSQKPKMQKPSNNINDSFLEWIELILKNVYGKVMSIQFIGFIQ